MTHNAAPAPSPFTYRIASLADVPAITALMQLAIEQNMQAFLSKEEIEAAKQSMGIDRTLIEDGTYFLIEASPKSKPTLVGCGGWGKRRTLYGGDDTSGRDDSIADPNYEAARIRAMYTHPDWIRKGVGSLLLRLGEEAAARAGYKTIELGATLAGEPFYLARGYKETSRETHVSADGSQSFIIKMAKKLKS